MNSKTLIIGIGASGCKILAGLVGEYDKLFIDTDPNVKYYNGLQIGLKTCPYCTCYGNADLGEKAAIESQQEILKATENFSNIILIGSFGGGTGCGTTKKLAELLINSNKKISVIAGLPFDFEGLKRNKTANNAVDELEKICTLIKVKYEPIENYEGSLAEILEMYNKQIQNIIKSMLDNN